MVESLANIFTATTGTSEAEALKGALVHGFLNLLKTEHTLPRRLRAAQQEIIKNPMIRVMPADKGSRVVILDNDEYIRAGEAMLSDVDVYVKLTSNNPIGYRIDKFNEKLENILPEGSQLLKRFKIAKRVEQLLPYIYFLPKIHKPHPPLKLWPIVS